MECEKYFQREIWFPEYRKNGDLFRKKTESQSINYGSINWILDACFISIFLDRVKCNLMTECGYLKIHFYRLKSCRFLSQNHRSVLIAEKYPTFIFEHSICNSIRLSLCAVGDSFINCNFYEN